MNAMGAWRNMVTTLNEVVSSSIVGRYFKINERGTSATTELRAATTTFLSMAYVIAVTSSVLAESGGTCPPSDWPSPQYESCVSVVKSDLVVAISLVSTLGCFAMGVLANLPFGLAPGTGPSMYMAYNIVGLHGSGSMSYENALGLWMAEAVCFLLVSGSGLRAKLARFIPISVRLACAVGMGLFMAFVGLQIHQGVGLIGPDPSSLVTMTACSYTDPTTGECHGQQLESPTFWLGLSGFLIMAFGLAHDVKGSMIYGILFVTFISWFRGTSVTYFPYTKEGNERYNYFKKLVDFHMIRKMAGKVSFRGFTKTKTWVSLLTLLYIDLLASTGGMYTLAEIGGFINEKGSFENEYIAYLIDAGVTLVSCLLGTPLVATYGESITGMREGGKTGLTAVIIGLYFLLALFFAPLLASVPPWAIGPSLVMIGVIMMRVVKGIEWNNVKEAVPAFVTIILMPLTSSIPNGIVGGIGVYVVLNLYDWLRILVKQVPQFWKRSVRGKDAIEEISDIDEIA